LGDDKNTALMHFGVKNSNSAKIVVYDLDGSSVKEKKKFNIFFSELPISMLGGGGGCP